MKWYAILAVLLVILVVVAGCTADGEAVKKILQEF